MEGRLRLGQFTRQGTGYQETWVNGWSFTDLERSVMTTSIFLSHWMALV